MKFHLHSQTWMIRVALVVVAVAVVLGGCASEPAREFPPHDLASEVQRLMRIHSALHGLDARRTESLNTLDSRGNLYLSAIQLERTSTPESAWNPRAISQIFRLAEGTIPPEDDVKPYATNFEDITAMLWHDGGLHVMHGPHYCVLVDVPKEGSGSKRLDRSTIAWSSECCPMPSEKEVGDLQATLADKTKSNEVRIRAMWKLNPLGLTPVFITALHNGPDALRAEAAKVLRVSPGDKQPAIKGLIHRAKNDTNAKVRMEAALTLGHLKAKEAVAELFGSLDDPDDVARVAKIMAIRNINDWASVAAFVNSSDERTRDGALLALTDIHEASAVAALSDIVVSSPYPVIRLRAVELLERVTSRVTVNPNDVFSKVMMRETLRETLSKHMTSPEFDALLVSLPIIRRSIDAERILEALRPAMQDEDETVRSAAQASMNRIEAIIKK